MKNRFLTSFGLILAFLFASVHYSGVVSAQTPPPGVRVDVSANPSEVEVDQEVEVTLTLIGNGEACQTEEIYRPLRVALIVDRSGSMGEGLGDNGGMTRCRLPWMRFPHFYP